MSSKHQIDQLSRYLAGPIITVIAGEGRESLYVHFEALSTCDSPSLSALVAGNWKEAHEKSIDWSHIDAATVKRFFTFLYLGDYGVPDPEPITIDHAPSTVPLAKERCSSSEIFVEAVTAVIIDPVGDDPSLEAAGGWPLEQSVSIRDGEVETSDPRPLTPVSRCLEVGLPLERIRTAAGVLEEMSYPYHSYHYRETLLAEAHVYTFAEYHLLEALQTFTLQRLTQILGHIDCTQAHAISDVTPLIRYVYSNTAPSEYREEPIRKLVSQFAAIHYTDLMRGDFETFFSEGGDFALDVAQKVSRRLVATGGSTTFLEGQVDDLEAHVRILRGVAEDREGQLRVMRRELEEWRSGARGTTKKPKKKNSYY